MHKWNRQVLCVIWCHNTLCRRLTTQPVSSTAHFWFAVGQNIRLASLRRGGSLRCVSCTKSTNPAFKGGGSALQPPCLRTGLQPGAGHLKVAQCCISFGLIREQGQAHLPQPMAPTAPTTPTAWPTDLALLTSWPPSWHHSRRVISIGELGAAHPTGATPRARMGLLQTLKKGEKGGSGVSRYILALMVLGCFFYVYADGGEVQETCWA